MVTLNVAGSVAIGGSASLYVGSREKTFAASYATDDGGRTCGREKSTGV